MPYTSWLTSHCHGCGRPRGEDERFSARGKCPECGEGRMVANRRELLAHSGPFFDHWRRRCLLALGVAAPPEREARPQEVPSRDLDL